MNLFFIRLITIHSKLSQKTSTEKIHEVLFFVRKPTLVPGTGVRSKNDGDREARLQQQVRDFPAGQGGNEAQRKVDLGG